MTPEEFTKALQIKAKEVGQYAQTKFPTMAGDITLRFIDGNYRAQGYQGATFKKWKKKQRHYAGKIGQTSLGYLLYYPIRTGNH